MNHRRKLLAALGTGALAAPFGALAQQPAKPAEKIWRVGYLTARRRAASSSDGDFQEAFLQGMRERGYVEGKNLAFEWHAAERDMTRLPGPAAALVQSRPDLILAFGPQATSAARGATATIPIVMAAVGDPVVEGFVASLARPGGNITGPSLNNPEITSKRLELLLAIAPAVKRVAFLFNPANRSHIAGLANLQSDAQKIKVSIVPVAARTPAEIEAAFAAMRRENAGGAILNTDAIFNGHIGQIAQLALKHRLPSICGLRDYVDAGCLMSYGASFRDAFHRSAYYADRIFKGAKPADLPVEEPTKFELFINGKTAKALGLKIPYSLLITAERVIE